MPIAAVPAYLGADFSKASPGLRFGMYLPLWEADGPDGAWRLTDKCRAEALRKACALTPADAELRRALAQRQEELALPALADGALLAVHATAVAPFTTGLGNEHPTENGFAFLAPYGLPYLPGSGVKGVLRAAARELAGAEWGDSTGWSEPAISALFGLDADDGSTTHQRGALAFWDVIPQLAGDRLRVDVMTPHQSHYLQGSDTPHDSGLPNPIAFLTVPSGSGFAFHVSCDRTFLTRCAPGLAAAMRWQTLLQAAFQHAFQWLGFGAKTAVGYGAMQSDSAAQAKRQQVINDRVKASAQAAAQAARAKELSAIADPIDREIQQFYDARTDKNQPELSVLFNAVKRGQWDGGHKLAAARRVEALMRQAKSWKELSTKKNPDKDRDYQDTLLVKKWLAGG